MPGSPGAAPARGLIAEAEVERPRKRQATIRTDDDTINLVRRLAQFRPDDVTAGILNRQGRTTACRLRFDRTRVRSLRNRWNIQRFDPAARAADAEPVTVKRAAGILGVATSTVHRWLNVGFIDGEQATPGAPWRIRITEAFRPRFMEQAPPDCVPMREAVRRLGASRQTVMQRARRGTLEAVHIRAGRKKALRIKVADDQPGLFEQLE